MRRCGLWIVMGMLVGSGCGGGGGGGGGGVTPPVEPVTSRTLPRVSLSVAAPAGRVGATHEITWSIAAATNLTAPAIFLTATAPGEAVLPVSRSVGRVNTGSPVAQGITYYLTTTGAWSETPTAYAESAQSGNAQVTLPVTGEGLWRFDLRVRDGEDTVAAAGTQVLVSDQPRISLRLNRTLANSGDVIRAELLTAAGSGTQVKVAARLTLPDGSTVSLPGLNSGFHFAYEGPSLDGRLELLSRPMVGLGTGEYQLRADLLDAATLQTLGLAEATFQVCDTPGTVSGVMRAANGSPLDGAADAYALVRALDIDDLTVTASAEVGSDGSYSLDLVPGRYLLRGEAVNAEGLHQAESTDVVTVGCGGAYTADLTAATPGGAPAAARIMRTLRNVARPASRVLALENNCWPLPPTRVLLESNLRAVPTAQRELAKQMSVIFYATLEASVTGQGLAIIRDDDVEAILGYGSLSPEDQNQIDAMVAGTQFVTVFALSGTAVEGLHDAVAVVSDISDLESLRSGTESFGPTTDVDEVAAAVESVADRIAMGPTGDAPLGDLVAENLNRPLVPMLTLTAPEGPFRPSDTLDVTVSLTDLDCTPVANAPVTLNQGVISETTVTRYDATTGIDGTYTWLGLSPGGEPGDLVALGALYEKPDGSITGPGTYLYTIVGETDLRISGDEPLLAAGDFGEACATLEQDGVPVAGATLGLTASRATLWNGTTIGQVTTDAVGEACFAFAAGWTRGVAEIEASYDVNSTTTERAAYRFMVGGEVNLTFVASPSSVPNGGFSVLTAGVDLGGDTDPSGVFVAVSQSGEGSIAPGSGFTDAAGTYRTRFVAPTDGSGTTTVTATVVVDGQTLSRDITLTWGVSGEVTLRVFAGDNGCDNHALSMYHYRGYTGDVVLDDSYWGVWDRYYPWDSDTDVELYCTHGPVGNLCEGTGGFGAGTQTYSSTVNKYGLSAANTISLTLPAASDGPVEWQFDLAATASPILDDWGFAYGEAKALAGGPSVWLRVDNGSHVVKNIAVSWSLTGNLAGSGLKTEPSSGYEYYYSSTLRTEVTYQFIATCELAGGSHGDHVSVFLDYVSSSNTTGAHAASGTDTIPVPPGLHYIHLHVSAMVFSSVNWDGPVTTSGQLSGMIRADAVR